MAPKAKISDEKVNKKLTKAEELSKLVDLFENFSKAIDNVNECYKECKVLMNKVSRKKVKKAIKPIPVPDAIAKFITMAIKKNKFSENKMKEMQFNTNTVISADDKLDRNQVNSLIWDYTKNVCKSSKDSNDKTVYECDKELKTLLKVDSFMLNTFNTHFAALYPKAEKVTKKKTKKNDSTTDEETSDSDSSSDSDSDSSSESESESDNDSKAKGKNKSSKSKN